MSSFHSASWFCSESFSLPVTPGSQCHGLKTAPRHSPCPPRLPLGRVQIRKLSIRGRSESLGLSTLCAKPDAAPGSPSWGARRFLECPARPIPPRGIGPCLCQDSPGRNFRVDKILNFRFAAWLGSGGFFPLVLTKSFLAPTPLLHENPSTTTLR